MNGNENKNNKKESKTIWFDEDRNKYYITNNETGEMVHSHKTGDFIKQFDASLTGSVNYNQRVEKAQNVYIFKNKYSFIFLRIKFSTKDLK